MSKPLDPIEQPFMPRYQVTGVVGEGAAAHVYRVVDQRDGTVRAIKALKSETNADPDVVKRFEDEYRILRRLHHPSLPEVFDYGFTKDRCRYMVMELVEGDQLGDYFNDNPKDRWLLLYELCEAITFIHSHDLLHLDLKPANILVKRTAAYGDEKPMLMLMDFGLSYRRDEGGEINLVGTPEYMAPEIIRGDGRLTRAADYYSIGITLFELLVGKPPFQGNMRDVFAGHLNKEIKFRQEKTEYSELYPHVLGLVQKQINPRLEAFEDFRRAVIGRLGGGIEELDRAYGLSVISSIGMIGKTKVWPRLDNWIDRIREHVEADNCRRRAETTTGAHRFISPQKLPSGNNGTEIPTYRFGKQVQCSDGDGDGVAQQAKTAEGCEPERVVTIAGPMGSGKSHLVSLLINELSIQGCVAIDLGDNENYDLLVDIDELSSVSVRQNALDRYVRGWCRLEELARNTSAVLVVDGLERVNSEIHGFLEYLKRRMDIASGEDDEPNVFLLITGNDPKLDSISAVFTPQHSALCPLTLAHPQQADVVSIVDALSGGVIGAKDRSRLLRYISRYQHSFEGLLTGLVEGLLTNAIVFNLGKWSCISGEATDSYSQNEQRSYLESLWSQIGSNARSLLTWLVCHDGEIASEEVALLSSMSVASIRESIATLVRFHLINISNIGTASSICITNCQVQRSLRELVEPEVRWRVHHVFIGHYEHKRKIIPRTNISQHLRLSIQLSFQYEHVGQYRNALTIHLKAIKILKSEGRFGELRDICERSIFLSRRLPDSGNVRSFWHIERYFLKQWIEGEWLENNYEGVVKVINDNFDNAGRPIPHSFLFKYCLSLDMSGRMEVVPDILRVARKRVGSKPSQALANIMVLDGLILGRQGRIEDSNDMLDLARNYELLMTDYALCRLYVGYSNNYELLGEVAKFGKAVKALIAIATEAGFVNELQIGLTAHFNILFEQLKFDAAKRLVRKALRISVKHGLMHRQGVWYFRASGIYYEEGNYRQALKYASRALRVAENIGEISMVCDMLTRHAMIYQNLGLYGNSSVYLNKAFRMVGPSTRSAVKTLMTLFAFDLQISANGTDMDQYKARADEIMIRGENNWRRGYYQYLLGLYYLSAQEISKACEAFSQSRMINTELGVVDDELRAAIKVAWTKILLEDYGSANKTILDLGKRVGKATSRNIIAEYWGINLAYHYSIRSEARLVKKYLRIAERFAAEANEVPTVLSLEKLLFRVNARIAMPKNASSHFKKYMRITRKILANMGSENDVVFYLDQYDDKLIRHEYKILSRTQKESTA